MQMNKMIVAIALAVTAALAVARSTDACEIAGPSRVRIGQPFEISARNCGAGTSFLAYSANHSLQLPASPLTGRFDARGSVRIPVTATRSGSGEIVLYTPSVNGPLLYQVAVLP